MPTISYDDLESALFWASSSGPFDNVAYVSKTTGEIFYSSETNPVEEELPDDVEDEDLYCALPHKNDLDLGRTLVFDFVDEQIPDQYMAVQEIFRHRGAYARFKDLLERAGQLHAWFEYEQTATERALLGWAEEQGISVTKPPQPPPEE